MNLYELTQEFATAMQAITVDPETGEVSGFEAVDGLDAAFEDKAEAYQPDRAGLQGAGY